MCGNILRLKVHRMDGRTSGAVGGGSVCTPPLCRGQRGQRPERRPLLMCWMRAALSEALQSDSKSLQRPGWKGASDASLGGEVLSRTRAWPGDPGGRRG